jgi:Spy/CpxP family protein refolding chaperone
MRKEVFVVLAVLALLAGGLTFVAAAHEPRATEPALSDGMTGSMGEMMRSRMGMMGPDPMMGDMAGMSMRPGPGSAERPWPTMALHHRDQLGLSADQTKELESLRSELEKKAVRQSAEIRVAEFELADLLRAEPVDMTKVEATLSQVERLRTELRLMRIKTVERGRAVLTPDQWKKLQSPGLHHPPHAHAGMMGGRHHAR